ncbi:hypothetical protein TWF696_004260 [Orbilia brochopaga]|uniref:Uncharacterized protein n=1 Tax=Orbilia brochopaga TaxID=3140254 RepID=A0AAV9V6A8_9PEZI
MSLLRIAAILSAAVAVVAPPPPDPSGTPTSGTPLGRANTNIGGVFQPPNTNILPATPEQLKNSGPLLGNLNNWTPEVSSNNSPSESREMELSNTSNLSVLGGTGSQNNTPRSIYRKQARYLSPQDRKSGKSPFRPEKVGNVQWKDLLEIQEREPNMGVRKPPVLARWGGMHRLNVNRNTEVDANTGMDMTTTPMVFNFGPTQNRNPSAVPVSLQSDDVEVEDILDESDEEIGLSKEVYDEVDLSSLPPTNDVVSRLGPVTSPRLQTYLKSRPPVMYYGNPTGGQGETVNTARLQYAESQNAEPQ